jgi:hypothetical protein
MTATKTPPRKSRTSKREPAKCSRFPCDSAYRRSTHTPTEEGTVVHRVSVGEKTMLVDDEWSYEWAVSVVAMDDLGDPGPWHLYVEVPARSRWLSTEEAEDFAREVTRAALWAAKYNLRDAGARS